jgi:UrcA family protein
MFNTLFLAAALAATPTVYEPRTKTVSAADLNLASEAGQATLERRVAVAVRSVCAVSSFRNLREMAQRDRCLRDAERKAGAQVAQLMTTRSQQQLAAR